MATLYEYAVFKEEKLDKDGDVVEPATILVQPTTVVANDPAQVSIRAAKDIPENEMANLDRIQVVVRPF